MTMTDAAAAAAQAQAQLAAQLAALRASAVADANEARWAAMQAAGALDHATRLVVLRGQEAWLGPARDHFDARGEALRARLAGAVEELQRLRLAIDGAV